jgi:c-di-GMP-binding flagellar brake protein YcgR
MSWYRRLTDRRGRLRFELVGELAIALRTIERLTVRDISWRGALVESTVPLPVESAQSVRFAFGNLVGEITARVRHVTRVERTDGAESYRIGFEFLDLQPAMREEIGRLAAAGL